MNIVCHIASEFIFRIMILLFAFDDTPKMQFSKTKLSVLNPMNSLQSKHGYKWCSKCPPSVFTVTHTLAVEYATANHAVLIQ